MIIDVQYLINNKISKSFNQSFLTGQKENYLYLHQSCNTGRMLPNCFLRLPVFLFLLLNSITALCFSQVVKPINNKQFSADIGNFKKQTVYGNDSCFKSYELCSNGVYPATINGGLAAPGPYYGCLNSAPNPSWFHFKILQDAPSLTIRLESTRDIDYICWGPFYDSLNTCDSLTFNKVVNCSYSAEITEELNMYDLHEGKYYILLVTNYSNLPCDINVSIADSVGIIGNHLPLSISLENPECNVLQLSATGGFNSYQWNTGATSQSIIITDTGNYTVIGKLPGTCDAFNKIAVTELIPPFNAGAITIPDSTYCHSTSLTAPGGYISYLWNTGDTTQIIQVSEGGTYSVIVFNSDSCIGFSAIEVSDPLPPFPAGQIMISDSTYCYTTVLTAPEGYPTYRWNTGDTTQSIIVSHKGTYSFVSTDNEGCDVFSQITVNAPNKPYDDQGICVVSYDKATSGNTLIIDKVLNVGIDSIFIYRSDEINNYSKIASISINDSGIVQDQSSDPDHFAYNYRLKIKDTCGRVSSYSQSHKTMLLAAELASNRMVNLTWSPYEGVDYYEYHVFRSTNNEPEVLINLVNSSQHSCSDLMPSFGLNSYQVKVIKPDYCLTDPTQFISANSNIVEVNVLSIGETGNETIRIIPNPAKDFIAVNCDNSWIGREYSVHDFTGRIIITGIITDVKMKIDLSSLDSGLYTFSVDSGIKPYLLKLVIQN